MNACGLVNFYRGFIPNGATILHPLLSKSTPNTLTWTDATVAAFNSVKEALAEATLLVHPQPGAPTCIMADAFEAAVGAVLQQFIGGQWQPLAYFSQEPQTSGNSLQYF